MRHSLGINSHSCFMTSTSCLLLPALESASTSGRFAMRFDSLEKNSGFTLTGPSARMQTDQQSLTPSDLSKPSPKKHPPVLLAIVLVWPFSTNLKDICKGYFFNAPMDKFQALMSINDSTSLQDLLDIAIILHLHDIFLFCSMRLEQSSCAATKFPMQYLQWSGHCHVGFRKKQGGRACQCHLELIE